VPLNGVIGKVIKLLASDPIAKQMVLPPLGRKTSN